MVELIQWPRAKYWDRAWNPVIGCRPVSPACENCWAREWAGRFGKGFEPRATKNQRPPKRGVVFCGNMTDLFGDWCCTDEGVWPTHKTVGYIKSTLQNKSAIYLWLTKRPDNMVEKTLLVPDLECVCECMNHYFGFTAENQDCFRERYRAFYEDLNPRVVNMWLSAEPLLGPINLCLRSVAPEDQPLKWVVVGCESGRQRRPCKLEWVESVVEQCLSAGVPVFVKQLDLGGRCVTDIEKFPHNLQIRQVPWAK